MSVPQFPWNRIAIVLAIALVMLVALLVGYAVVQSGGNSVIGGGKALIGGPFTLTDQDGKTRTEKDFLGRNTLVYFGYTFCPDVCPTELAKISAALDLLPQDANVTPVFITIDPERDGVAEVKAYAEAFHPRTVGLTGTVEQVRTAAKAYRVYFAKNESSGSTEYLMDHSSFIFLMDKKGDYAAHFTIESTPEQIAAKVRELL
jgi:cytochrome oxidase Cu insertion factor (SCO1/SenC/PrrC family)